MLTVCLKILFGQAVVASLRDVDESATTAISDLSLSRDVARLSEVADLSEGPEDDDNGKPTQCHLKTHLKSGQLKSDDHYLNSQSFCISKVIRNFLNVYLDFIA